MTAQPPEEPRRPDAASPRIRPLRSLFLLLAVCGCLFSLLSLVARQYAEGKVAAEPLLGTLLIGAVLGTLLGGAVGSQHYRRLRETALGAAAGLLIGLAVAPLVLLTGDLRDILLATCGLSLLLVVIAIALRLTSGN